MVKNLEDMQKFGKDNVEAALKSFDSAIEVQNAYFKSAYEGFVAQANKIGSLYVELARDMYKPFEGQIAKAASVK